MSAIIGAHREPVVQLTARRRAALVQVRRGLVEYATATADFVEEGLPVGGWDRRTYSDLQRAGLITFTDGKGTRRLRLTKAGEKLLDAVEGAHDTPTDDSP